MVIKKKRIRVKPEDIESIRMTIQEEFGKCCRSTVFNALNFSMYSKKSERIRELALDKYKGVIIQEDKVYGF